MRSWIVVTAALMGFLASGSAVFADASGKALGVNRDAKAETKSEIRELQVGSDIFLGDRVTTDARGLVQVRFSDNTKLVIGPNSSLVIEDYLLRDDGSSGKLAIDALAGTFRFVTGGAPKDRYLINTPTGTIGVRGTAFDFTVRRDHFSLLLFHGAVEICNTAKQCVTAQDICTVGLVDQSKASILGLPNEMENNARQQLRGMFPYAVNEAPLMGTFRVSQARDCLNRAIVPVVQDPVGSVGDGTQPQRPDNWRGGKN
jgi:hypothetical protein